MGDYNILDAANDDILHTASGTIEIDDDTGSVTIKDADTDNPVIEKAVQQEEKATEPRFEMTGSSLLDEINKEQPATPASDRKEKRRKKHNRNKNSQPQIQENGSKEITQSQKTNEPENGQADNAPEKENIEEKAETVSGMEKETAKTQTEDDKTPTGAPVSAPERDMEDKAPTVAKTSENAAEKPAEPSPAPTEDKAEPETVKNSDEITEKQNERKSNDFMQGDIAIINDPESENGITYPISEAAEIINVSPEQINSVLNSFPVGLSRYAWGLPPRFTLSDIRRIEDEINRGIIPSNVVRREEAVVPQENIAETLIFAGEGEKKKKEEPVKEVKPAIAPAFKSSFDESAGGFNFNHPERRQDPSPAIKTEDIKNAVKEVLSESLESCIGDVIKNAMSAYKAPDTDKAWFEKSETRITSLINSKTDNIANRLNDSIKTVKDLESLSRVTGEKLEKALNPATSSKKEDGIQNHDIAEILKLVEIMAKAPIISYSDDELKALKNAPETGVNDAIESNTAIVTRLESRLTSIQDSLKNKQDTDTDTKSVLEQLTAIKDGLDVLSSEEKPALNDEIADLLRQILDVVNANPAGSPEYEAVSKELEEAKEQLKTSAAHIEKREAALLNMAKQVDEQKHLINNLKQEIELLNTDKDYLQKALENANMKNKQTSGSIKKMGGYTDEDEMGDEEFDDYDDDMDESEGLKKRKDKKGKHKRGLFG